MNSRLDAIVKQPDLVSTDQKVACAHCGTEVQARRAVVDHAQSIESHFCCHGCLGAYRFIQSNGLADFYRRREQFDANVEQPRSAGNESRVDWRFLDDAEANRQYVNTDRNGDQFVRAQVGGMYCPSCAWLLEKALTGLGDGVSASVDLTGHTVDVVVSNRAVPISSLFELIENLGYRPGLQLEGAEQQAQRKVQARDALKRICVAGLGMMQVMTYAVASYLGEFQGMDAAHQQFLTLVSMLVATVVVFYAGRQIFVNAVTDLANARLGMDVPIAIAILGAYVPSVYFALQANTQWVYFDSAVMFVFFILVTRFVESNARSKLNPGNSGQEFADTPVEVVRNAKAKYVMPKEIRARDQAIFNIGQVLPFDARVLSSSVLVDESNLTGEAEPQVRKAGENILAGAKILSADAQLEATSDWQESSAARLQQLLVRSRIKEANRRSQDQAATRYFVLFTLLLTAIVAFAWWWIAPGRTLEIALAMLVASCPCAFALAEPLAVTAAVAKLRRAGVWVADFSALAKLSYSSVWAFDKTGTLTQGSPEIRSVHLFSDLNAEQINAIAVALLVEEAHPFARAFKRSKLVTEKTAAATQVQSTAGAGVNGVVHGQEYWLGKPEWVKSCVPHTASQLKTLCELSSNSLVALADGDGCLALFELADPIRPEAKTVVDGLQQEGAKVVIVSGDRGTPVRLCGADAGVDHSFPELTPEQKRSMITAWQSHGEHVVMVGDGTNDAPALNTADVAIAMTHGATIAQTQADILLMHGRLGALLSLLPTARKMVSIIRQNRRWALFYNLIALPLAAAGILSPWLAVTGMSVSSLLVVLNASRLAR